MRRRDLRPGYFSDEKLGELPPLARILFAGLWAVADREGRAKYSPRKLWAEILPYDPWDGGALFDMLIAQGEMVRLYEVAGQTYLWLPNFGGHQRIHPHEAQSHLPAHPDDPECRDKPRNVSTSNDMSRHLMTSNDMSLNVIKCRSGPSCLSGPSESSCPSGPSESSCPSGPSEKTPPISPPPETGGREGDGAPAKQGRRSSRRGKGKRKRGSAEKPPPPEGYKALVEAYWSAFKDVTGSKPAKFGSKEGGWVKELLVATGLEEQLRRLGHFKLHHDAQSFGSEIFTLQGFYTHNDRWAAPPKKPGEGPPGKIDHIARLRKEVDERERKQQGTPGGS